MSRVAGQPIRIVERLLTFQERMGGRGRMLCLIGMTIFRICLLGPTERVTEVRWVSARTRAAALALARKALHASEVSGF